MEADVHVVHRGEFIAGADTDVRAPARVIEVVCELEVLARHHRRAYERILAAILHVQDPLQVSVGVRSDVDAVVGLAIACKSTYASFNASLEEDQRDKEDY